MCKITEYIFFTPHKVNRHTIPPPPKKPIITPYSTG